MTAVANLRAAFEENTERLVGLEEELFLVDGETLDLLPRAREVLAHTAGDPRFKLELPASQLEIVMPPARSVPEAIAGLAAARRELAAAAAAEGGRLLGVGAHPFASPFAVLNSDARYQQTLDAWGSLARRQLVCGLHVHVSLGGADRTLAVYNALRAHLPELAALAANAPFHEGRDTGLASIRPMIATLLPRQGVPPAMSSWEAYAEALRWGGDAGSVSDPRRWWWELRPHTLHGTLELRVPDTQATVADVGAVAAFAHALIGALASRYDAGEDLGVTDSWRIEENRRAACRAGLDAGLANYVTGARTPAREVLAGQIATLGPVAEALGCAAELAAAGALAQANGAVRLREVGLDGAAGWLAERFLA